MGAVPKIYCVYNLRLISKLLTELTMWWLIWLPSQRGWTLNKTTTSWFKPWPFDPLIGAHDSPLKGSRELTIPKRAPAELPGIGETNCQRWIPWVWPPPRMQSWPPGSHCIFSRDPNLNLHLPLCTRKGEQHNQKWCFGKKKLTLFWFGEFKGETKIT